MLSAPKRRGFSLVELVVALAVAGVGFGAFAIVVAQQERGHGELSRRVRARAQATEGGATLAGELRAVSPGAGDIAPGHARDSAIEFRTAVGSFVVCSASGQTLIPALASFVTAPQVGDTAFAYVADDRSATWRAFEIVDVQPRPDRAPLPCPFPATAAGALIGHGRPRPGYALGIADSSAERLMTGTPVRLTRRVRFSLYRAPDGRWYLGRREWSSAASRFESIQPVSGPYRGYAAPFRNESGLELSYFDRAGSPIPGGAVETHRIARVEVIVRPPPASTHRGPHERRDWRQRAVAFRDRP